MDSFNPLLRPFVGLLLVASVVTTHQDAATAQTYDVTLHVDGSAAGASDSNMGTAAQPLLTVQEAMDRAISNKLSNISTEVLIHPGVYREYVDVTTYTNYPSNQPGNTTPILVEGTDPSNRPIISGANVWTGWTPSGNHYTHAWPYDWGAYEAPWQNTIVNLTEIVRRREVVWIDGDRLDPVLELANLTEGTFFVDEDADLIHVYPPSGVSMAAALVEVAERERVWGQEYEDNLTIRNVVFEKTNGPWDDGFGMVRITGSENNLLDNVAFRYANWTGLYSTLTDGMVMSDVAFENNGGRGFAIWKIKNVSILNASATGNNWRGYLQGTIAGESPFTGWTTGGANIESAHGVTINNFTASDNFTRGTWFDTDVIDVTVTGSDFSRNQNDGMFIEAVQGPVEITNSTFMDNLRHGIFTGMAEQLTLDGNTFDRNGTSPIRVSGANNGRGIVNFETSVYQTVLTRWWTLENNEFYGEGPYLIGTTVNATRWAEFINSLTSDNNDWCDPSDADVFQIVNGQLVDFDGWKSHTGEDQNSTFCAGGLPVELVTLSATVDRNEVSLFWETASENGNAGFEVEHEIDGFFVSVGFVSGAGTTSESSYYRYTVRDLAAGTHRFRLRQIDHAGTFSYSSVVEVAVVPDEALAVSLYPNPVAEELSVLFTTRTQRDVTVSLYDALGREIRVMYRGSNPAGTQRLVTTEASTLPSGLYFVRVDDGGRIITKAITVAR